MRFSYSLIKQLVPGLPSKKKLIEGLNLKTFETEDLAGDAFDVSLLPNRYPDCASHWGIAREAAAIFKLKIKSPAGLSRGINWPEGRGEIKVRVENLKSTPRYLAAVLDMGIPGRTPDGLKKTLVTCGLRPINPVVDVMNYAMLETGQPLHAFDAQKIKGGIIVREAKPGEEIVTLDGKKFSLTKGILVIADEEGSLAIAGLKGGKRAEVTKETKKIVVEAANFEAGSIYAASRALDLVTDASARFSRSLSSELAEYGLNRALFLLKDVAKARLLDVYEVYPKKQSREVIQFGPAGFSSLTGLKLDSKTLKSHLESLGFRILDQKPKKLPADDFLVEAPFWRLDVTMPEDLVEEVVRLYGYDRVPLTAPVVSLKPAEGSDSVKIKERVRLILKEAGFSEVYNYSFSDEPESKRVIGYSAKEKRSLEIENPIAADKKYLRSELATGLAKNLAENAKYFESADIFEIGRVFSEARETLHLGLASWSKANDPLLRVKGAVEHLMGGLAFDAFLRPEGGRLLIETGDHRVLGYLSSGKRKGEAVAELNLDEIIPLMSAENRYEPLPKYPSVVRDISLVFPGETRVADALETISETNAKDLSDIELIDYFDPRHFTFRLVFQSPEKTLEADEVSREVEKITRGLKGKLRAEVR